jgi:hypothetical protein
MISDVPFLDFTPADSVVKLMSAMFISPAVALCLAMAMSVLVEMSASYHIINGNLK